MQDMYILCLDFGGPEMQGGLRLPLPGWVLLVICAAGMLFFSAGCVEVSDSSVSVVPSPEMNETLGAVCAYAQTSLAGIGEDVRAAAGNQSGYSHDDPLLTVSVRELYQMYPWAQWAVRYSQNGSVIAGYPFYGADTPYLGDPMVLNGTSADSGYLLSQPGVNANGMDSISVSAPVYTKSGGYDGYVSLEMYPWMFYQQMVRETGYPSYSVWLVDTNGVVYCSPDAVAIGENILTDSLYAGCKEREIVRNIAVSPEGAIVGDGFDLSYGSLVEKVFVWRTISAGGRDVCVILSDQVEPGQMVFPAKDTDLDSMRSTAAKIYLYAKENGREETLAVLNDPKGRFVPEGGAAFAFDMNGTLLADSVRGNLTGENFLNYRDGYGVETIKILLKRSWQGGGFVPYCHPIRSEDEVRTARLCLAYVLPMDETWVVGVVQPFSSEQVPYLISLRDTAQGNVQAALSYVDTFGKDAALAAFMDPEGVFVKEGIRLYAMDVNGTILADGKRPYNVGINGFFFTDRYGGSMSRLAVMIAEDGGGYLLSLHDTQEGTVRVVLQYIRMVDEEWLIGATVELGSVAVAA